LANKRLHLGIGRGVEHNGHQRFLFNVYKRFLFLSRFLRFLTFFIFLSLFLHLCLPGRPQRNWLQIGQCLLPLAAACIKWKKTLAYLLVLPGSRVRIVQCGGRDDPQLVKRSSE